MKDFYQHLNLNVLISAYFSDPEQRINLEKGDYLMREGDYNDRLFLVLKGSLSGYFNDPDGHSRFYFRLQSGMFAGVYSFFSQTFRSSTTIIADEPAEVAFIDRSQKPVRLDKKESICEQFMPVVAADLAHRQQLAQHISFEKQQTLKKLIETEKLASLGQMAAGISHELNNAVAVLQRGSQWLSENLAVLIQNEQQKQFFDAGNQHGRHLSTRDVRQRKRELQQRFGISDDAAEHFAETGVPDELLPKKTKEMERDAAMLHHCWEIGASLCGMRSAANHATYVSRSVKTLGAPHSYRRNDEDVNESIREGLALMYSPLRKINVINDLKELPLITANRGELVQIWINLIKNACDSLFSDPTPNPRIAIRSRFSDNNICVEVEDNGPGIPEDIRANIFQPNFTTKVEGLSFGLGLGLTIVQRLVDSYSGKISVTSKPGKTVFKILLPVPESNF